MNSAHSDKISLDGKKAFVTGASGGIGSSVCEHFINSGASILATDLEVSSSLQTILDTYPEQIQFKGFDISSNSDLENCSREVEAFEPEILFNNAAVFDMGSVLEADLCQFDRIFSVNVRAMYQIMQVTAKTLAAKGKEGSIINLASQAGRRGEALVAHYCASKAAVISYTQSAGLALARKGIRVNALSPGVVDTPMWELVDSLFAKFEDREIGEKKRLVGQEVPMGRMGTPEDIAKVALFLASDLAAYITCQTINVDGGNVMN